MAEHQPRAGRSLGHEQPHAERTGVPQPEADQEPPGAGRRQVVAPATDNDGGDLQTGQGASAPAGKRGLAGRDPGRAGPAGPGGRVGAGRRGHQDGPGAVQPLVPRTNGAGTEGRSGEASAGHGATGRAGRSKALAVGTGNPQDAPGGQGR